MQKTQSLADILNVDDPREKREVSDVKEMSSEVETTVEELLDITDPTQFCKKILESREFRQYVVNGIIIGDLPSAVITRVMDHAWGKPPERVEHTGKNGEEIKTVTEIRRVIVHPRGDAFAQLEASSEPKAKTRKVTH